MNKLIKYGAAIGGVLCAATGLDNRLEISRYTIKSKKLPESFDGFTIAHLSDLHSESMPELYGAVKALKPDIIACTGDMIDDKGGYSHALSELKAIGGVSDMYYATGNHDLWRNDFPDFQKEAEADGITFLRDKRAYIERDGERISISGIDDPFSHDAYNINSNIRHSLEMLGAPESFEILLFHRANLLDKLRDKGFDLILAGHLHGGQFRIPKVGGVLSPKSSLAGGERMFFPKYFGGLYEYEDTKMIVSRGLGNPMVIPRIFNRPELVFIKLERIGE